MASTLADVHRIPMLRYRWAKPPLGVGEVSNTSGDVENAGVNHNDMFNTATMAN